MDFKKILNEARLIKGQRIKFNDPDLFEKIGQILSEIQDEYGKRCQKVCLNVRTIYGYDGRRCEDDFWYDIPCETDIKEKINRLFKWDKQQNYGGSLLISFEIRPYVMNDKEFEDYKQNERTWEDD